MASSSSEVSRIPTTRLLLDGENPRFAGSLGSGASQRKLLNYIANEIGVRDLLSSMSRGGYYSSSPLIGIPSNEGKTVVVEGNRRLAAALILLNDERAADQLARSQNFPIEDQARSTLSELPVLMVTDRKEVLPYLGVAHIVGNKKWDSYAKAAWAASVLEQGIFPGGLSEIADHIGDTHRTLERMVEAYYLVKHLVATGRFDPSTAQKQGRGTAQYPFSWIYTALGFSSIREWLGIESDSDQLRTPSHSVSSETLNRAAEMLTWMFGDLEQPAALDDSRQISELAASVTDPKQLSLLRAGQPLAVAKEEARPTSERLTDLLLAARDKLQEAYGLLGSTSSELAASDSRSLQESARRVREVAQNIYRILRELTENSVLDD